MMKKNKDITIKFHSHSSAEDIVITFFRYDHPRMKVENLIKLKVNFELDFDNRKYLTKVEDVIDAVGKLGMWGFCDLESYGNENPQIHYWVGNKVKSDKIKVMELFAHEIAHASGYESENMAIKFGGISAFAYMAMMDEIYENDK